MMLIETEKRFYVFEFDMVFNGVFSSLFIVDSVKCAVSISSLFSLIIQLIPTQYLNQQLN